ncbi:MAG: tetratricopeptide repeat protein, partial [Eubacterium sp.]
MKKERLPKFRIISTTQLVRAIKEGKQNSERFCFIIGAGASESSGIPTGRTLAYNWMQEMVNDIELDEIEQIASKLKDENQLEYDFEDIKKEWLNAVRENKLELSSKYYFDIYKLRFFPNHRNGYQYLERIMADKEPSFGYHTLVHMLTDGSGSNLVITTNFDSLIEDALFIYSKSKPIVINHEFLADYAGTPNIKRPIIAKIHRGIFFDPLNNPEETKNLKGAWHDVLSSVFQIYTPIVIGYGGGDKSLMELLNEEELKMKNGIYWCYIEKHGIPNDKIQKIIMDKNGYLVHTDGFDALMLTIGNALYPEKIDIHKTERYLNDQANMRIENYNNEYKKLTETLSEKESSNEFKAEIEKLTKRETDSEKKRQDTDSMTAWDYKRQADSYYKSKDYTNAIKYYTKAIELQPNIAVFYNNRGYIYKIINEYDNALSDYNKAIELNPDYSQTYSNRGHLYTKLKKYELAINDFNKVINLQPDNIQAYNNRGLAYNELKDYDNAINDFNKVINLQPDNIQAYNNRG